MVAGLRRKQFSFMKLQNQGSRGADGYAMAALLVLLGVSAVMLTVAMPVWRQMVQREKEEELIFRGQQYARAVGLFQRKYAASFPPDIDTLVSQRFLRKKYKDPVSEDGEFQVLYQTSLLQGPGGSQAGQAGSRAGTRSQGTAGPAGPGGRTAFGTGQAGPRGGVIGVASKSTGTSIRLYNGRNRYNEWQFVYLPNMFGQGAGRPGMPGGGRGRGMGPGGRGQGMQGPGRGGWQSPDRVPRGPGAQPPTRPDGGTPAPNPRRW